MTNELQTIDPAIPTEYQSLMSLAVMLSKSNLVPKLNKQERYNAADIFVLASLGAQLGINPMTAITNIYIIEGRPTMSARLQRGMLLKNGHGFKVLEWTSQKVRVVANRKGEEPQEFEYTIAEAQHAGLLNKQTWKSHPRRMMLAAVTRNVVEVLFSDMFLGVSTDDNSDSVARDASDIEQLGSVTLDGGDVPRAKLSLSALRENNDETAKEGMNNDQAQSDDGRVPAGCSASEF